jgi:tetraacyldisaccharide 4'-kinase
MGEWALHRRVMAGEELWTLPLRGLLRVCSGCYGLGVALRNRRYDRLTAAAVGVPVVSVGNITTGGTGKTPLVIEIARRLQQRDRKVGVLSRGYKATPGRSGDELDLVSRRLPEVVCIADPNRASAAQRVITAHQVTAIVLDDGFQHRRLGRDLDVVAVDATCPFGFGHLLPRGLLRESPSSLRRASLIVVTRADQVEDDALAALHARLAEIAPQVPRVSCRHRATGLVELNGAPSSVVLDQESRVFCFSAIGNPEAFETTVRRMGGRVSGHQRYPDHHRYGPDDMSKLNEAITRCGADLVLTTEKDAVKLAPLQITWPVPVLAVRVDIDFLDRGDTIVADALDQVLERS